MIILSTYPSTELRNQIISSKNCKGTIILRSLQRVEHNFLITQILSIKEMTMRCLLESFCYTKIETRSSCVVLQKKTTLMNKNKIYFFWCYPIEVGCRGFAGRSLCRILSRLGMIGEKKKRKVIRAISESAEKASSWLWIKRSDPRSTSETNERWVIWW